MPRGFTFTLAPAAHTEVQVGGAVIYPSIAILNPNDGVLYVAENRDLQLIGSGAWDYKVPSQSYALLPGNWRSAGVYYLDQSGAGRNADVALYTSTRDPGVPIFNSIGRALQTTGTAMDVSEGAQPQNPGAGVLRLWADVNDVLHALDSAGTDESVISTRTALGGVLTGTLPNPGMAAGAAAANIGVLTGALAGSSLPATTIPTGRAILAADTGFAANTITNILTLNLPTGIWFVCWQAQLTPNNIATGDIWINEAGTGNWAPASGTSPGASYWGMLSGFDIKTFSANPATLTMQVNHQSAGNIKASTITGKSGATGIFAVRIG